MPFYTFKKVYDDSYIYDIWNEAMNSFWNNPYLPTFLKESAEMNNAEYNSSGMKYNFNFPGISPERVSVKLRSDKVTIDIYVDGKLQRSLAPTLAGLGPDKRLSPLISPLTEDNIKVTMEHGLLTIVVTLNPKSSASESITLPINGKKFLQEDSGNVTEL